MKKFFSFFIIATIATWFLWGEPMAWAANATENFEYTAGSDITGASGGSGFSGNWNLTASHTTMVDRTGGQSGNSADGGTTNADFGNDRDLSATVSDGHIIFYAKNVTNASSGNWVLDLLNATGGSSRCLIRGRRSGLDSKVHLVGATTDSTTMGTWTDSTWGQVQMEWGNDGTLSGSAPGTNKCKSRFAADGSTFGSWTAALDFANTGAPGNIRIGYEGGDGTVSTAGIDQIALTDNNAAAGGTTPTPPLWWILRSEL